MEMKYRVKKKEQMMKPLNFLTPFYLLVTFLLLSCSGKQDVGPLVIDERDQAEILKKTIPIDRVWAGHPVGFSLMTDGDRQYVAYYNEDRHMTVGQRNLDEEVFELLTLPAFDREEGGGTSTI